MSARGFSESVQREVGAGPNFRVLSSAWTISRKAKASRSAQCSTECTAFQYAQALEHATAVCGSQQLAEHCIGRPCKFLPGDFPLEIIDNWWGFQSVEDYFQRIELGIYN